MEALPGETDGVRVLPYKTISGDSRRYLAAATLFANEAANGSPDCSVNHREPAHQPCAGSFIPSRRWVSLLHPSPHQFHPARVVTRLIHLLPKSVERIRIFGNDAQLGHGAVDHVEDEHDSVGQYVFTPMRSFLHQRDSQVASGEQCIAPRYVYTRIMLPKDPLPGFAIVPGSGKLPASMWRPLTTIAAVSRKWAKAVSSSCASSASTYPWAIASVVLSFTSPLPIAVI